MSTSPLILRYAARSHVGKVRTKNDDSAYAGHHLAVVADGMGGHAGGDVASATTVLELVPLDREGFGDEAITELADEIQTANSLLSEMVTVNPKLTGMGTTVTALLLSDGKIAFAHIGDSRAYRLKEGVFEQISTDHTLVERLISEGRLTPEEAETHPHKNVLMRVLGDVDASPELDVNTFDASAGERWLLCSDGLNYVSTSVVEQLLRSSASLEEIADQLIDLTLQAGSPDNVTVVTIEVVDSSQAPTGVLTTVPETLISHDTPETSSPDEDEVSDPPESVQMGQTSSVQTFIVAAKAPRPIAPSAVRRNSRDIELGGYIAAAEIKEELASRPHELVGAALTANEAGKIPIVPHRPRRKSPSSLLASKAPEYGEELVITEPGRRRPWWVAFGVAVFLSLVVVVASFGYSWTQTQYYVGESNGKVAIFNGVSQSIGPIQLSRLYRETPISTSSLSEFAQRRLVQTIPAATLSDANQIVNELRIDLNQPDHTSPAPSPSPSMSSTSSLSSAVSDRPLLTWSGIETFISAGRGRV